MVPLSGRKRSRLLQHKCLKACPWSTVARIVLHLCIALDRSICHLIKYHWQVGQNMLYQSRLDYQLDKAGNCLQKPPKLQVHCLAIWSIVFFIRNVRMCTTELKHNVNWHNEDLKGQLLYFSTWTHVCVWQMETTIFETDPALRESTAVRKIVKS